MAAVVVFIPVEEVQGNLVDRWEEAEKGVRDLFREGRVEDPYITTSTVGLEEALVLLEQEEVLAAEEGTLVEAVGIMRLIPVAVEEDLITSEQINKISVATKQLAMVR